jgi:hypothetical protein
MQYRAEELFRALSDEARAALFEPAVDEVARLLDQVHPVSARRLDCGGSSCGGTLRVHAYPSPSALSS